MGDSLFYILVVYVGCRSLKIKDKYKIEIVYIEFIKCINNVSEFLFYSFLMNLNKIVNKF